MFLRCFNSSVIRSPIVFNSTVRSFSDFPDIKNIDEEDEERKKTRRMLKEWQKPAPESSQRHPFQAFDWTKGRDDSMYVVKFPKRLPDLRNWMAEQNLAYQKYTQRFIPERHNTLGNDLAVTHFLLHRGGKIRRKGHPNFLGPEDKDDLPTFFDPMWMVEEIDVSGTDIRYEGIENFKDLKRLRKVHFRGCENFDDWCLERVLAFNPHIQFLDASGCKKVTERCLEGLYRFPDLKTLVLTRYNESTVFDLTVLLLEDTRPDLEIRVLEPPEKNSDAVKEN